MKMVNRINKQKPVAEPSNAFLTAVEDKGDDDMEVLSNKRSRRTRAGASTAQYSTLFSPSRGGSSVNASPFTQSRT